jgi:import receptor subunit TOM5
MYGGQPSEEQKKLQEQYAYDTLKTAGLIAGALWVTPMIYHFIQKQLK